MVWREGPAIFTRCPALYWKYRQALVFTPQVTYNQHTEAISDRNNELHRISELLSEMKQQMEERGTNISDATPVVRGIPVRILQIGFTCLVRSIKEGPTLRHGSHALGPYSHILSLDY